MLHLSGGHDLRYVDQKKMGQVFVTHQPSEQAPIADYAGMGPEALEISREDFKARLRPFRGEIKGVLTRSQFVAGVGNAYADEILWHSRLHPYRKQTSLTAEAVYQLYDGMRAYLLAATEKVRGTGTTGYGLQRCRKPRSHSRPRLGSVANHPRSSSHLG